MPITRRLLLLFSLVFLFNVIGFPAADKLSVIKSRLRKALPYLRISDAELEKYLRDLNTYHPAEFAALVHKTRKVPDQLLLSTSRRLLLSTNYFKLENIENNVKITQYYHDETPCGNPFARFSV